MSYLNVYHKVMLQGVVIKVFICVGLILLTFQMKSLNTLHSNTNHKSVITHMLDFSKHYACRDRGTITRLKGAQNKCEAKSHQIKADQ